MPIRRNTGCDPRPDALLDAVCRLVVPADAYPDAVTSGAARYAAGRMAEDPATGKAIRKGMASLDALVPEGIFAEAAIHMQEAALTVVEGRQWFVSLVRLITDGFYADPGNGGNRDAVSWAMTGYRHGLPEGPCGPPPKPRARPGGRASRESYDAIVVGAGASGGVIACILAEAGMSVLLLERGRNLSYQRDGHRDHLANHRLSAYGHNTGPDIGGNPRVAVDANGYSRVLAPNMDGYHNIASGVGSGTFVYGGLAWRFQPDDFRMASIYGSPQGSSLADWPISYMDLEPHYDWVEWNLGVSGQSSGDTKAGPRTRDYPMPPVPRGAGGNALARGAGRLGLKTFVPPLLVNSRPRHDRGACIGCGSCVGFPCPSDGKNGTWNTVIPRALATGNVDLITGAAVSRILRDHQDQVCGVDYLSLKEDGRTEACTAIAGKVILCSGAIETARLLLLSADSSEPEGMGNSRGLVGRNLQDHYYPTAFGLFDEVVHESRGPGVSIATTDFNHGNPDVIGGAMLADDFVMPPVIFHRSALPPDVRTWGQANKDFMRENWSRVGQVKGPVHEIPHPDSRITLDSNIRDKHGLPVARLSGLAHPETVRTAAFMLERGKEWLQASGATRTWGADPALKLSAGQHQAGTCRMGTEPEVSVTDPEGRVWGHRNLYVADGSLNPTNGGYNPVLTIMAMAARIATGLAK